MSAPAPARAGGDRPLRVVFVIWRLHPIGGIPQMQTDLLRGLAGRGLDLHVVSVRPRRAEDQLERYDGLATLHFLGLDGPPTVAKRARAIVALGRALRRLRPDVLHVHGGIGWMAAALPGRRRTVLQIHDAPQTDRSSRFTNEVERLAVRWRRWRPVAGAQVVARDVADAWHLPEGAVRVVRLGIDTERLAPDEDRRAAARHALGLAPDDVVVLGIARLVPSKRPDLFVRAALATERAGVRFVLVGVGPLEPELRALDPAGLVALPGMVDDVAGPLAAADLFLSTSEAEGFGLAVAEAMAAGLAVVAFEAVALGELIDRGRDGVLVPDGDLDALVAALDDLLEHPDRRRQLAEAARARAAEQLSLASMADRYLQVWLEVANGA